ncbi:PREDICTED: regulator of G-protein signaling 3-like isoform X1 [Cyprinodon variegatus]|uniref:regulator of G-protein signaling 3-like isoform X1 n=2 Tax=Cyprinodon variegatus TaxID=28743 RepID=UPI000742B2BD|nr:PREDICTED: regulator of G-protein signaling 3-like isoform X1 [Cyprinodon variegatus]
MFWKNAAWFWDDAAGDEDDDGGFLLAADLRRTPDSAPDTDLTWTGTMASTTRSISNAATSCGPKETTRHSTVSVRIGSQEPDQGNYSGCVSSGFCGPQHAAVSIIRGNDGFGFTIFADCPVRVQAVDPGGPAHQAGLCQGDSVLQLNGLPVETWKCADLAQAIRSCPSQVVLVVWRGLPELSSAHQTLLHPQVRNSITTNKLLPHPAHSKHSRRAAQGREHRSGLGVLGSLWRGRREDQDQEDNGGQEICSTIKGTRITSSTGDNYIILSPVNQGEQLPHPGYSGTNGTIGRLYQTDPSRTQSLLHNPRTWMSQRTTTSQNSTLPVLQPRTMVLGPPGNHGNYQNCTIVQSHLPRSSYGKYASLPPKTLFFPIFVQPLDLCSPDRTLCMAEEMTLHKANLLPSKVTVLIYSDLLLLTREDDAGRCSVLQSPLYLKMVQFREVPSEPLHIYFLQKSDTCWCCLFSLEAFNIQQKLRVCLCLHSNIQSHMVTMETPLPYQFSDLPSDFDLLSLSQSSFPGGPSSPYSSLSDPCRPPSPYSSLSDPCRPPSPYFSLSAPCRPPSPYSHRSHLPSSSMASPIGRPSPPLETVPSPPQYLSLSPSSFPTPRSPVWKQRDDTEEERVKRREEGEERQQGEGESSSETSESLGGFVGKGLLLSPQHINIYNEEDDSPEEEDEEELICTPTVLRRSISEGSLLKEPRSPRFPSDSTIHRLILASTFELSNTLVSSPCPNSPLTLKKQLTKEGGSLNQMLLLLNGSKDGTSRTYKLKKRKAKSLAADIQSRLVFLQKWKNYSGFCGNSLKKALRNNRPSETEVKRWAESLEALLANQYGVAVFHHFLRSEFSEENLDFWLAVEKFKKTHPFSKMAAQAKKIYDEFISSSAVRQVNVDSFVRDSTNQSVRCDLNPTSFQLAQDQIFSLMETDSYPRFLKSRIYAQLANLSTDTVLGLSNNSRSVI